MTFYDLFQNFRIFNVDKKATKINYKVESSKDNILSIQDQINYLSVVSLALSELLSECGIPKERIIAKIREIDMRDGHLNNKTPETKTICSGCHRITSTKRTNCIYCGTQIIRDDIY